MPERSRFADRLGGLLPARVQEEIFVPALHDLTIESARDAGAATPWHRARWMLHVLLLFIDCWRIALLTPSLSQRGSMFATDLRQAFGRLFREPGFTGAAVLTLALAVGLNVAVFAVFEAVVLRPLPYPAADELVVLNHRDRESGVTKQFIAIGDYVDIAERTRSLAAIASYGELQVTIYGEEEPFRASALSAGPGLFSVLGARVEQGRAFEPGDHVVGGPDVLIMSHHLWQERYGADPATVGRSVTIAGRPFTVVGITPDDLEFPPGNPTDVLLPATVPLQAPEQRKSGWTFAVARLAPGQDAESATEELAVLAAQFEAEHPEQNTGSTYYAVSLRDQMVGNTKQALFLLLAAVGFVMLIAAANVANLQLARSLARRRDIAVRLALGAGWGRVATQFLAESLALTLMAGTAGVALALWGARALVALVPASVGAPGLDDVHLNGLVLGFALFITLVSAVGFGLVAALAVRGEQAGGALVTAGRASVGRMARRATTGLVVAEIALALVLVLGAGLVMRTFGALLSVDPGFEPAGVLRASVQLPGDRYREVGARVAFHRDFTDALLALPGVEDVGSATVTPLTGNNWTVPFERMDEPVPPGERAPDVGWQVASGGYFTAMGIPLLSGRLFDERDGPDGPPAVIVSRAIEQRFFPGGSAVGRRVSALGPQGAEIIGVVGDILRAGLTDEPRQDLYYPAERYPSDQLTFFIRTTSGAPVSLAPAVRAALRDTEPDALLLGMRSMDEIARASVGVTNLLRWLLGVFSACALVLAAVGIYGVMSYAVRQRTREIGTRMAVGATRADILLLVLRDGSTVAVVGVGIGLLVGVLSARALRTVLFGVTSTDPVTLAAATIVLVATALLASWLPARRAASVDAARTLSQQ